ncbi:MAG TPA: PQQ-binding-like beta-propeller repeat protein [Gemmataceae bacterium]|nr:PQQ-binding-like beta-propeller repeat protein [Gemmataceae bacterium]
MKHASLTAILASAFAASLHAENWPQWRGPSFDGGSPEKGLVEKFSPTENVKWTAPMPGPSAATPIVWGDRVFVSTPDAQARTLLALCLDRHSGKELWRHQVASGIGRDNKSNFSSPSPATDGKLVVFFYGSGELAAFDFAGKKLWERNLQTDYGQFAFLWTFSTSPLLHDGKLYVQVLQRDTPVSGRGRKDGPNDSYLLALNPATGRELWKRIRPADAREESLEAFTSPVPVIHGGRSEILVAGGDCITGHDPASGKELWRWGTWNPEKIGHWRLVPSPVAGGGVALACGPKGAPVYAVRLGKQGNLDDSAISWKSAERDISSDVSTPLFYQGRFYVLNSDKRSLACVEPSGTVVWNAPLNSKAKIEASPTAGDGKIYVMNHSGEVFVVAAGPEFKLLHTVAMADAGERDLRSSIAISQGDLFIRTTLKLYCVGKL